MVAGCGKKTLKYSLVTLNTVTFLLALAGVIICAVLIIPGTSKTADDIISKIKVITSHLPSTSIRTELYVILAANIFMLIISFLGWCATGKESKCLLKLYATILFITIVIEVTAFAVAIISKDKFESHAKNVLTTAKESQSTAYGDIEKMLKCCGVEDGDPCIKAITPKPKIGCYNKIVNAFKDYYSLVLSISMIAVVIEILLIFFSCCLGKKVDCDSH